jgi:hypothetical protein
MVRRRCSGAWLALRVPLLWRDYEDAAAERRFNQAFLAEQSHGALDGSLADSVRLLQSLLRGDGTVRRELAAFDLLSQDRGELYVDRRSPLVVDLHQW